MKLVLLALLALEPAAAKQAWLRISSPHFEVLTDAGEKTGREVIQRFEEIRRVFLEAGGDRKPLLLPVRVFVFATESGFRPYRPTASTTAFYQSGPQRDYIAMRYAGAKNYRVVFHEYVHLVLNHTSITLPQWLEEGTAEFYSTLESQNGRVRIGAPIHDHLATLRTERWLTGTELAAVDKNSPNYNERGKVSIFYAQSWALVHMLNLAPKYRQEMPHFAQYLADAAPPERAFEQAFHKTMDGALKDLPGYLQQDLAAVEVDPAAPDAEPHIETQPLDRAQASLAGAELLLLMGRIGQADKLYQQVARTDPDLPAVAAGLAGLAMRKGKQEEARRHFERAIALGSRDAGVYFEYAMLLRDLKAPREQVDTWLQRTVELNPNYAEAHFLLALRASDAGRWREAVDHLRQATAILPRQAYFWNALGYAHYKLGQLAPAERASRLALETATTTEQAEMARSLARLIRTKPPEPVPSRPPVFTPESWRNRPADSRVEGVLTHVDCFGQAARLEVLAGSKRVLLLVKDPSRIVLRNAPSASFQLGCGASKPLRVAVEYIAGKDAGYQTIGEVTAIEFR